MVQTSINMLVTFTEDNYFYRSLGEKRYELSNHLGNVLSVISDRRLAFDSDANGTTNYYEADVMSAQDYDPFGMLLVGRSWEGGSAYKYRFGFNTQEQDNEVYGDGNLNTALFWEYDTRLGRRWNADPMNYLVPFESPYCVFHGNSVVFDDQDGDFGPLGAII